MIALLISLNVLSALQLAGIAMILHRLIKPRQVQSTPFTQTKTVNHKPVYLTADHERKVVARMTDDNHTPYEDVW